jgi:hypothetical protein
MTIIDELSTKCRTLLYVSYNKDNQESFLNTRENSIIMENFLAKSKIIILNALSQMPINSANSIEEVTCTTEFNFSPSMMNAGTRNLNLENLKNLVGPKERMVLFSDDTCSMLSTMPGGVDQLDDLNQSKHEMINKRILKTNSKSAMPKHHSSSDISKFIKPTWFREICLKSKYW